jgi:hypothetical protein
VSWPAILLVHRCPLPAFSPPNVLDAAQVLVLLVERRLACGCVATASGDAWPDRDAHAVSQSWKYATARADSGDFVGAVVEDAEAVAANAGAGGAGGGARHRRCWGR